MRVTGRSSDSASAGQTRGRGLRQGPTRTRTCPCSVTVDLDPRGGLVRGLLVWILPLVTLGLYLLAVLAGRQLWDVSVVAGVLVLLVPLLSFLATLAVQAAAGHRDGCLLRRTIRWWLTWPGATLLALGGIR